MARRILTFALSSLLSCALMACGEEDQPGSSPPEIATPLLECGDWLGDSDPRYDGDVLQRIEVKVTDPDSDVSSVVAVLGGAVLPLTAGDPGTYSYDAAAAGSSAIVRCDELPLLIRAVDGAGNATELLLEDE